MESLISIPILAAHALGSAAVKAGQGISLRKVIKLEAVLIKASSVAGSANVRLEYVISDDGVTFGAYADEPDIIVSTSTLFTSNPEAIHRVALDIPLAPFIKLQVTELTGSLSDTLVDLSLLVRRSVGG